MRTWLSSWNRAIQIQNTNTLHAWHAYQACKIYVIEGASMHAAACADRQHARSHNTLLMQAGLLTAEALSGLGRRASWGRTEMSLCQREVIVLMPGLYAAACADRRHPGSLQ